MRADRGNPPIHIYDVNEFKLYEKLEDMLNFNT